MKLMYGVSAKEVCPLLHECSSDVGVVRSGQVVRTEQWRHDAGSHSTDHSRRVRLTLWAVQ